MTNSRAIEDAKAAGRAEVHAQVAAFVTNGEVNEDGLRTFLGTAPPATRQEEIDAHSRGDYGRAEAARRFPKPSTPKGVDPTDTPSDAGANGRAEAARRFPKPRNTNGATR